MKKKFEMELLNSGEMQNLQGGASCSKSGDTILCAFGNDIKLCKSAEANCGSGFSSTCSVTKGITLECSSDFSVKPKPVDVSVCQFTDMTLSNATINFAATQTAVF